MGDKKIIFAKKNFFSKVVGNSIIRLKTLWGMGRATEVVVQRSVLVESLLGSAIK